MEKHIPRIFHLIRYYMFVNYMLVIFSSIFDKQKFFKAYFKESNPMPRNGKFSFLYHAAMFWMGQTKNVNFEKTTLNMSSINEIILWNRSSFLLIFLSMSHIYFHGEPHHHNLCLWLQNEKVFLTWMLLFQLMISRT